MMLNRDAISDILARVDGKTLANVGCVSSEFWSVARQEIMWEKACCSLWPSLEDAHVKNLIFSSLGGFRSFYANCFPFVTCETSLTDFNCIELRDKNLCHIAAVPSDFISMMDVQYKEKFIFSKVVWEIPCASGDFDNCPFKIDILSVDDDQNVADRLPTNDKSKNAGEEFCGHLMDNIKLSWIVINQRTGQIANLSSRSPLSARRYWPSDNDFVMCFGSVLPAHQILPCKAVLCKLVMKCRFAESDDSSLKVAELRMVLQDMIGAHVNQREGLGILQRALDCTRTMNHNQTLESYHKYLREQSKLREEKIRSQDCMNTLSVLSGIFAFVSVLSLLLRLSAASFLHINHY